MKINPLLVSSIQSAMPKPMADTPISVESHLLHDLGIDSLSMMNLTLALETNFGVSLTTHIEALAKCQTVAALSTLIDNVTT